MPLSTVIVLNIFMYTIVAIYFGWYVVPFIIVNHALGFLIEYMRTRPTSTPAKPSLHLVK